MSLPSSIGRRRIIAGLAAIVTAGSLAVVSAGPASASPSTPKPAPLSGQISANQKSPHPVREACPAPAKKNVARCFSLVRTDVTARKNLAANVTPDGYGPADITNAYNLPTGSGAGQLVAIVDAYDDPNVESDLAAYRAQYGLPACTSASGCFQKVNQTGAASPLPTPDQGWSGEISLDVDMVSAACPLCKILLVEGTSANIDDLGTAVNTAVSMGAKYVSNSYGLPSEAPDETTYDPYYNHAGVAVTVSTGDAGTGPSWPATSPYVTAVGGTSLTTDGSTRGWNESAWSGAGSGCSDYEAKPAFQTDTGCAKRVEADVSAVADPNTGVAVYQTYGGSGWAVYGGTSASSPIVAATYALAGQPIADTYPNSYPYAARASLNDVTTGNNGTCGIPYVCNAGPGYDGPTGLGTPNGVAAFRSGPHGTVSGTVTDSATKSPIAGATVTAGDVSATSGSDGKYTVSLPVGTYSATAAAYAYKSVTKTGLSVTDGGALTADFALTAVPKVSVGGTVTDGSGHGWPLYAKITVDGVPGGPVYSDPFTGHYSLDLPRSATYAVHVDPVIPGYLTRDVSVKVGSGDLVKNVTALADSADCASTPGYATKYAGLQEPFDGSTAPAGWTVKDNTDGSGGATNNWVFNDPKPRGNLTGGTGGFAIIDSDFLGTGKSQDSSLLSPVVDLSKDTSPIIALNTDYKEFTHSVADIDLSVDGGTTWSTVWHQTTTSVVGPVSVAIPQAAGKSAVQVRFHYTGTFDYFWQVDDVLIGQKSCVKVAGGLVEGFTSDGNTHDGLPGVTVTSGDKPADSGLSAKTPDDGNIGDGYYWLFSSLTGSHPFTAKSGKYTPTTQSVNVVANYVTRSDFSLAAGQLTVSPAPVQATVTLGDSATRKVKLTNTGTKTVHVKLGESDGGFTIQGVPAKAAYAKAKGAAVQHIKGTYSPTKMTAQKASGGRLSKPAAVHPAAAPWQSIADYPTPISNNAMAYDGGKVYSVGGFDGANDEATGYVYDPSTLAWTALPNMSTTREAPSAAFLNGKLYVLGGWGPDANPTAVTEVYDPSSNNWSTAAPNPKPHAGAGTAVLDGKIYLVGGCNDTCGNTDVQVYDPSSDSWSSAANYPGAIAWVACGGIDSALYCAGGNNGASASTKSYSYDSGSDSWSPIADLPADDWGAGYAAANGQLVVSGGVISASTSITNEGWAFDPTTGAWAALPNSNNAFYRLGSACGFFKAGGSISSFDPPTTKAEVLPGYDSCGAGTDVPWLSESPAEFDVAAGQSATVTVTLDSSVATQPGTYSGAVSIGTDSPYSVAPVTVKMIVKPPSTWGKVTGVVTGVPCTGSATPLAGATVQINSWSTSYTLSTGADGSYALWLDYRNNPLSMIVAKDGWQPQSKQVTVTQLKTVTASFALKPAKACK